MKVLVADSFEAERSRRPEAAGCEVVYQPDAKDDGLTEAVRSTAADVLVVRSTKVTSAMLDAGRLALIVRAGAGYNTIDVAAASKRGIYVSNCPGKNAIAVAELTFGADPGARSPHSRQRRRAARRQMEQEGVTRRRAACAGRRSAFSGSAASRRKSSGARRRSAWTSSSGAGASTGRQRPISEEEARALGLEAEARLVRIELAPTPAAVADARRYPQRPPRVRARNEGTCQPRRARRA